jgi:hypothetical protein
MPDPFLTKLIWRRVSRYLDIIESSLEKLRLTVGDIPPYRCTTSATADRRGRAVCAGHARSL